MTTTTMSDLPRDLAEEILSRIPLKSTRAVRLTCKKWDTLSKNRSFTKIHADAKEGMMVLLMDYKLYLMNADAGDKTPPQCKLTCLDKEVEMISQICQCEGLFLCILKDTLRLVVWNPYWGQTRWIEPRYSFHSQYGEHMYSYALGYSKNKNNKSFKILRFIDRSYNYVDSRSPQEHFSWYEIYDLETGLWKTLDITSPAHWFIISTVNRGVSVKGNTYWICAQSWESLGLGRYMICFDFTRERFGRLLPLPWCPSEDGVMTLSCVREEKLAALFQRSEDREQDTLEIWITTKIEAEEVSWSKFLAIDMETVPDIPISVTSTGNFLVDEEKRLVMFFDTEDDNFNYASIRHNISIVGQDGYSRQVDLGEHGFSKRNPCLSVDSYCWTHACSYIPSLVQIKQGGGCKRRNKQSSLERRRCDEKKARLAAIYKQVKQWWRPTLPIFKD